MSVHEVRDRRRAMRRVAGVLALAGAGASVAAYAQGAGGSVWGGVYSADQATRGKATYDSVCAACHGPSLGGGDSAPALSGGAFLNNWNSTSAGDLFERIHTTMPASDPGSLSARQVADVEAYIFQANGFPAGQAALPSDDQLLAGIKIQATKPAG